MEKKRERTEQPPMNTTLNPMDAKGKKGESKGREKPKWAGKDGGQEGSQGRVGGDHNKTTPNCRHFFKDRGCRYGDLCRYLHPKTEGRCTRCGSTEHEEPGCERPKAPSCEEEKHQDKWHLNGQRDQAKMHSLGLMSARRDLSWM